MKRKPGKKGKEHREEARKAQSEGRWQVPDGLWEKIAPLLPAGKRHPLGCHRPATDPRKVMNAILFVLRTGCQWKALDATGICPGSTAHRWFQRWREAGVFCKLWQMGLEEYDAVKGIDWSWQSMDGAMTKAPLGGEKDWPESHRPSQVRRKTKSAV